MSTQRRSVLKNWFRKGLTPTQAQFADAFDSFFHKSEDLIPLSQVSGLLAEIETKKAELQDYLNARLSAAIDDLDGRVNDHSDSTVANIDFGVEDDELWMELTMLSGTKNRVPLSIPLATTEHDGMMSAEDRVMLTTLALQASKSVITVAGMDFTHGDILEILKGNRPTRYAVMYETETNSYMCGILDAYTSSDGRIFTEIYTGGCDLAKDFTGGTHDSGRIYQFMRQYHIVGSGTPAGTWSAWQSCLSSAAMDELYAMGLDYKVYEDLEEGYIEVKLTGKEGGVVGGSTEIPFASSAKSGFMSKEDKARLDGMEDEANKTIVLQESGTDEKAVMSQAAVTLADAEIQKELNSERLNRSNSDAALQQKIDELELTVPNQIRTDYSDDGVSVDLWHNNKLLWSDTIEPATRELAGVMPAEDKRKLDAALYQVDDTDYFSDYVDTQIRGYDGDGHSVIINAATESHAGVMSAEDKIRLRSLGERIEEVNNAVTEAITEETSRAEKEEQGLGQRIDDLGDNVTTSRVNITDGAGRQMFHFNATSNGTMQFVSDEGDGFMFKDETDTVGTTRVSVSAKGGVNVLSTRQVQVASDNGISLRSSNHRVSLSADNDILSLYGKSLQASTDRASVAMDNSGNVDINADAMEYKVGRTWHLRTVSDGNNAYHVLVEQGQVKFRCSEDASLAVDGENGLIKAVAGDFRFVFKDGTEREVLMSELLDRMAASELEISSLRTDVEYLKENGGSIGGSGSHSVEGEMLIVGSGGEIIKVSQLENDKGYLTGSVNADKIILLDD